MIHLPEVCPFCFDKTVKPVLQVHKGRGCPREAFQSYYYGRTNVGEFLLSTAAIASLIDCFSLLCFFFGGVRIERE